MTTNTIKFNNKKLPFSSVVAINDLDVISIINSASNDFSEVTHLEFLKNYKTWIAGSKNNAFKGLDSFSYSCFTNGTTEGFEKFYGKHSSRNFRFFKGEYTYHRLACRNFNIKWSYIEDEILTSNDAVIISLPFSNTGGKHQSMDDILKKCDQLGIPVLVDCAYFGICSDLEFDLSYNCITDVTFSLSKVFPVSHYRIGMRLTKVDDDDPLFVLNKIGYVNQFAANLGNHLIKEFSPDYIYEKYKDRQAFYCDSLNLEKSNSVLFGLSSTDQWKEYDRGATSNRLSFHNFFHDDNQLFLDFISNYEKS